MKRLIVILSIFLFTLSPAAFGQSKRLTLATTTSTDNSGLLPVVIPPFEKATGIQVDIIAVGTGAALALGRSGDVDVVLVHARVQEDAFVSAGYGVNRRSVMHNDFVIIGPANDPAGIEGMTNAVDAMKRIMTAGEDGKAVFVSRGDNSGTNIKENELWQDAGVKPSGNWYKEVGQGMGAVITLADQLGAYTLSDRGTYISMQDKVGLKVLSQGDPVLYNPYGIIAVNPEKFPYVNYMGAMELIAWFTSPEGQKIIRNFTRDGEEMFFPDAVPNP